MDPVLEDKLGRLLARWVNAIRLRPGRVTAVMLLATVAILAYTAGRLEIQGDTESLFSPELSFKQAERRYYEAFPTQYENMFVVIDAVTPERAGEAATALAAKLSARPDVFHAVYLPGGGEFFEEHAFLYLETEELQDLADRLAEVQPYLAELSRDRSLRGLTSMMARGVRAVRDGDVDGTRLVSMFDHFGDALDARLAGEPYHLSWAEVLAGGQIAGDARRRFLLVQPVLDVTDIQPGKRSILTVREAVDELGLNGSDVSVRITGDVALSYEEMEAVSSQAAMAGLASFVLVGLIMALGLRSTRMVLSTLLTLLVGLVWTAGYTAATIGHLNMISVSFAVLFIGLGVDFGIHLCIRYRELLVHGREHGEALVESSRDVGSSLVLCATTTAIGFFAFVPTDFVGVAELGAISGAGMFISLFCTLTLLPALLSLPPHPRATGSDGGVTWTSGLTTLPLRYPRAIRTAALVMGLGAVTLLPEARFENNPLSVRDPSTESVRTFRELLEKGSTSPWSLNGVAPDIATAEAIAEKLRALDVVDGVVTVADYVPPDQEEKLGIIEDVALFLAPLPGPDGTVPDASTEEQIAALHGLQVEVRRLLDEGAPTALAPSAARLAAGLDRYLHFLTRSDDPGRSLAQLEAGVVGALPEQLRTLNAALAAGRVTLQNLPDALLERMVTADGRVRIQVFPRYDLADNAALAAFVDGVREVMPGVSGSAAEVLESGRTVVAALQEAMLAAFVAITLFLLLLWRRLDDTALVMIPLCLAAALTVAASVLADIPFNFADVIVLPLLLGIGVDSGIHLVHRARVSRDQGANLLGTSTARAVAYASLTTIASFGTMGFASHLGLATLGRLLTLGVSFTLLCNLLVLPALIALRRPRPAVESGSEAARV